MGAALMLIFKVVGIKDAINALDFKVYLLVASTIMLSIALFYSIHCLRPWAWVRVQIYKTLELFKKINRSLEFFC